MPTCDKLPRQLNSDYRWTEFYSKNQPTYWTPSSFSPRSKDPLTLPCKSWANNIWMDHFRRNPAVPRLKAKPREKRRNAKSTTFPTIDIRREEKDSIVELFARTLRD
eukprot:jgi/Bigna1/134705/aug1.26_g9413